MQEVTYPYSIIASNGLGLSYSSYEKIGNVFHQKNYGGAQVKCWPNLVTGNLVFQDRVLPIQEANFSLNLRFIYNSRITDPAKVWQFSHKKFIALPNGNTPGTLQEEDGHLTTYKQDPTNPNDYLAQESVGGTKFMRFDSRPEYNSWILHDPETGCVEYYDSTGFLTKKTDRWGRATTYHYENGQLRHIVGPTGNDYEIRYTPNTIAIYDTSSGIALNVYEFDALGRLITSTAHGGYQTKYTYYNDESLLRTVSQTDGTYLGFSYEHDGAISTIKRGGQRGAQTSRITYQSQAQAFITDAFNSKTTIGFNTNGDLTSVARQTGYNVPTQTIDLIQYTYTPDTHQLQDTVLPGGGIDHRDYNSGQCNLLKDHVYPAGQHTEYVYTSDFETRILLVKNEYVEPNKPLTTSYVYQRVNDGINLNIFLRFVITPEGRVTEYRPDDDGNIKSKRTYLKATFPKDVLNPTSSPDIAILLKWVEEQQKKKQPNAVSLEEYTYDTHGQVNTKKTFANVDENGNGIEDAFMGYQVITSDLYGNVTQHDVKQDAQNTAETKQTFDGVNRLTQVTDALQHETTTEYQDAQLQVITTYANGKITVAHKSDNGLTQVLSSTAKNLLGQQEYREYEYARDTGGRITVTTRPDGIKVYSFYDRQNRLGYTVTALGIVTEYQYDEHNRFNTIIAYANPINISQLEVPPPLIPPASVLIGLVAKIKDPAKDHQSYTFFDKSGRKQYEVDTENYVTQYFYDTLNREVATIRYAVPLSDANLSTLKQGGEINLPQDFTQDRAVRKFYDDDGLLIGKQDAAGFVTQLVRDAGGRITGKVVYYTKAAVNLATSFDDVLKIVSEGKLGVTHYEHDARGQIIAKLNPEGYYTEYTYSPNGLRLTAKLYANKPTGDFPSKPESSPLDQLITYEYDLLGRKIKTNAPFNRVDDIQFDVMGNLILNKGSDSAAAQSTDGDFLRQTATQYDGWNQAVNQANVYVGKLLAEAKGDPNEIKKIWANKSQRHVYDKTGLLLSTTDPLGHTTYFYYDADRRPVLKIAANLSIEESTLDSFGKEIQNRQYANFYDVALGELTGGLLTPEFYAKITGLRSDLDHVIAYERDKRSNIIKKTDAEKNISQKSYNAFNQVDTELLPVNSSDPTLQIKHGYDPRGNKTALVKTDLTPGSTAQPISESWEFDSPLNIQTKHTNALGGVYEQEHDLVGNVITKKSDGVVRNTFTHDFISRVATESDAYKNTTQHTYGADHSHTVTSPDGKAKLVSQLSAFEQVVQETDVEKGTTATSHASDGQASLLVDQLKQSTSQGFDNVGQKKNHVDARKVETAFGYTSVGFVERVANDANAAKPQAQTYGRDAFGNATQSTDPRDTNSGHEFDRNNNLTKTTTDVGGLNLVKAIEHNAQGKQKRVTQTDVAGTAKYVVERLIDGFNRDVGKVVDPDGLKITTQKVLDAEGNTIRLIDPSGFVTRNYFNTLSQKRFKVTPTGGLRENFFDENGRIRFKRVYANKVQVTDDTTFEEVKALAAQAASSEYDGLLYYFYDENGNEKYRVNSMGFVSESVYNNANPQRVVQTILYYTPIDPSLLAPDFKTSDLASKITVDPKGRDRSTYYVRDAKGQVTRKIDGEGCVIAQQFNEVGKPIIVTRYANKLAKPIDPKVLPLEDPARDRVTYYVYDNLGRRTFKVELTDVDSRLGRVTKYNYDEDNNPTQTITFNEKMLIDGDYQTMVGFLGQLIVSDKDNVQTHSFDKANRLFKKMNGLGKYDEFTLDCLGLTRKHKNKNGFEFGFGYDGAKRLTRETSPEVNVVSVAKGIDQEGIVTLTPTQTKMTVDDTKDYHKNGKIKTVTKGANTNNPRSQEFEYDGMKQLASTTIKDVDVDDATKESSYVNPPTKKQAIQTQQVCNGKNLVVAKQDESLRWSFTVYNSEGFEVYAVGTDGSVHQTIRNAFQEVIGEVLFADVTTLELSQYVTTGIPLKVLEADMASKLSNPKNRVNSYTKDNVGNTVLAETGGPTVFYALVNGEVKCAVGTPTSKFSYNAFRERTYRGILQYPTDDQQGVWSEEFWWHDKVGNHLAKCNTNGRVDAYIYGDAFHKYTQLSQWAAPLTQNPTTETTYAELMSYHQVDPNRPDHEFERDYDVIGREIADRQLNAVVQKLVLDPKTNKPTLLNLPPKTLETKYDWDALDNKVGITYPDGGKECHYFDGRNDEIAQTKVTRTSQDENGAPILVTPLTYFGRDAFRQKATRTKFKLGTSVADPNVFPQPLALSAEDQEIVKLFDIRGLPGFTADGEKRVSGHTYSPMRTLGRSFGYLTDPTPLQGPVIPSRHIDDIRYQYGAIDKPVRESRYRDNVLQLAKLSRYNAFSEIAADGVLTTAGEEEYYSFYDRDPTGKIWRTNAKTGTDTLALRNLAGYECLSAQSTKKGLIASLDYATLPDFLNAETTDIHTLERKQTERDKANRAVSTILPGYEIPDPNHPQNVTMSAVVGSQFPKIGATSISWEIPAVTTCIPEFIIWPVASPDKKQTLAIKMDGARSSVDVSALPTDVYAYQIDYNLRNADGSDSKKLKYQVQGQVQFDTRNTNGSERLVVDVQHDDALVLTGNTTNLTAIKLFQDNVQVGADIPVTPGQPVDVSHMASGVYTIQPVVTGQQDLPQTLPFTIYTNTPSATPLSREIDATFELKALNQLMLNGYGQLIWTVSEPYNANAIKISCTYEEYNQSRSYQTTVTRQDNYGTYSDQHGNSITANIRFPSAVSKILNLTVSMDIGNGEEICILNNYQPSTETGDGNNVLIDAQFSPTTTLHIVPETEFTEPPVLNYLDVTSGIRPQWKALKSIGLTKEGVVVDVTGIPEGNYAYTMGKSIEELRERRTEKSKKAILARHEKQSQKALLRREQPVVEVDGADKEYVFTIGHGSEVYSSTPGKNPPPVLQVPVFKKGYDNFDNNVTQTDTLQNTTTFGHDVRNKKVSKTEPKVDVQNEDGTVTKGVNPVTLWGFNERGFNIGKTDANGHTRGRGLDEAGQLVQDILPSGLIEKGQVFDALRRRVAHIDSRKNKYTVTFDRCDNQRAIADPNGDVHEWEYDEKNSMSAASDPAKNRTLYKRDINGNNAAVILPVLENGLQDTAIEYQFDLLTNQPIYQKNPGFLPPKATQPVVTSQGWLYGPFGHQLWHQDLSGAQYHSDRDGKNQVVRSWSEGGDHGQTIALEIETVPNPHGSGPSGPNQPPQRSMVAQFIPVVSPTPNKDLRMTYRPGGLLSEASDVATGKEGFYDYDASGRQNQFAIYQFGNLLRSLQTEVDALNREVLTLGPSEMIAKGWDRTTNIVNQNIALYPLDGPPVVKNLWNTRDEDDRVLIYGGTLQGNVVVRGDDGYVYTYQDGLRQTQTAKRQSHNPIQPPEEKISLIWDVNSRLKSGDSNLGYTMQWGYDAAGRPFSFNLASNGTPPSESTTMTYSPNWWIRKQVSWSFNTTTTNFGNFDGYGNPWHQDSSSTNGVTTTIDNQFVFFDSPIPSIVGGTLSDQYGTGSYGWAENFYSSNGGITGQRGVQDNRSNQPPLINRPATNIFFTDPFDHILTRFELIGVDLGATKTTLTARKTDFLYDFEFNMAGSLSEDVKPGVPPEYFNNGYMPRAAGQRELSIPAERYYNQSNDGSAPGQSRSLVGRGYRGRRGWYSDPNIPGQNSYESSGDRFAQRQANFKIGLQVIDPVSDSFPPANTGYYVVRDGDTLESIAQAAYGDSSYANLIGEANAKNDDTLKVGDRLVLPTMFQSRFKSSTGEPYELLKQQIVANLYPILDVPQPPDNDDDSIFDAIVDIIIVVAAVVFSGGNPLLAAAIAAETEAEVEAVEVALGMRNSFSLKHVAQIAVEAGFAAGTGDVLSSLGKGITIPEEVAIVGASAVTEQLTEMKLGLRDHFDLQAIIEQMAEAGITAEIAPSVNVKDTAADQEVEKAEDVLVNTVVSGVVESVFEGQLSAQMLENLAANALGTEVGDAIGNDIDPPRQETAVPTSSSQQTVPQPNVFERVLHEAEAEVESLVDDIKDLFDPTVVAPNAQKPAASIAKKMSQQGMFARKLTQEREADDGIDLRLNPNAGMGKPDPAQLGKGLNLSDSTSGGSGVSKTPTTKQQYTEIERMDGAAQVGITDALGITHIGTSQMNYPEEASYLMGGLFGVAGSFMTPEGVARAGAELYEGVNFLGDLMQSQIDESLSVFDRFGVFGKGNMSAQLREDVFHVTKNADMVANLLKGVDVNRLNSASRFGKALYVSVDLNTAVIEATRTQSVVASGVRLDFDFGSAKILDLTDQKVASEVGYVMNSETSASTQVIGELARQRGYNAIMFNSVRALGVNYAILDDFDNLLSARESFELSNVRRVMQ